MKPNVQQTKRSPLSTKLGQRVSIWKNHDINIKYSFRNTFLPIPSHYLGAQGEGPDCSGHDQCEQTYGLGEDSTPAWLVLSLNGKL